MKYTKNNLANKKIQEYVDVIKEEILKDIPYVKSIIMGGGFGRGEGSVEIANGKFIPINDMDIFIISNKPIPESVLNKTSNKISSRIGLEKTGVDFYNFEREKYSNTFYLDLKSLTIHDLKHVPPIIRYYELKESGMILYGEDVRKIMPKHKLFLAEGFRSIIDRMAMLGEYFSMDYLNKISVNEKRGLMYLACNKAYHSCCAGLLFLNGKFTSGYEKRSKILSECYEKDFPELAKRIPDLPKKVEEAVKFKFNPDFSSKIDPFKEWSDACFYLGEVAKFYASRFTNKKIDNYEKLSDLIYDLSMEYYSPFAKWYIRDKFKINLGKKLPAYAVKTYFKLLFYFRLKKYKKINNTEILRNKSSPDLTFYAALVRLIYSVDKNKKIDRKMLIDSGKLMNKVYPTNFNIKDDYKLWNEVGKSFANAYVLFCFLKII